MDEFSSIGDAMGDASVLAEVPGVNTGDAMGNASALLEVLELCTLKQ